MILSAELKAMAADLPNLKDSQLEEVAGELRILARLAASMEHELAVHRLGEARRQVGGILEDEATKQLVGMTRDLSGQSLSPYTPRAKNVITPDFGRKA